jgi:MFS family permease
VLGSYFGGFTGGAVSCGRIIERIGNIRAYAAFAGLAVTATAAMPLQVEPPLWLVLRVIVGYGLDGISITIESWLNAKARNQSAVASSRSAWAAFSLALHSDKS